MWINVCKFPAKMLLCFDQLGKNRMQSISVSICIHIIIVTSWVTLWQTQILNVVYDTNWWGTDIFLWYMSYSAMRKLKYDYKYTNWEPIFPLQIYIKITTKIMIQNELNIVPASMYSASLASTIETTTTDSTFIYFFSLGQHINFSI